MKYLKKVGFSFIYILGIILILSLVATIFNYLNIISDKVMSILKILIPIIAFLVGGFVMGKKSNKSGYIEGLKLGGIASIFLIVLNFILFDNSFRIQYLLFYIILTISSILGSMIGINKKN